MAGLFGHLHRQLAAKVPKLEVTHVRIEEHHARVLLDFGRSPERTVSVAREGHGWKMTALIDSQLP
jgi:hypothetical protein